MTWQNARCGVSDTASTAKFAAGSRLLLGGIILINHAFNAEVCVAQKWFDDGASDLLTGLRTEGGALARQTVLPPPSNCSGRGNYNPDENTCSCALGWAGDDCEHAALSACRTDEGGPMYCTQVMLGAWYPRSCECLRQCFR